VVPNTANNAKIFEFYFNVNGIDFNPLTKIECVVQNRGIDIFNGFIRLSAVLENPDYTDYELYIMGDVGDFASEIRDLTLQDLRWDDLQHELVYSSITQSWLADNTETNGLFGGKILYPMINYGLPYQSNGTTPLFTYTFNETYSFNQNTNPVPESVWKPSVKVKEVINRIFEKTQYTVNSEFFDTDYFKAIYMDTFQNGRLGVTPASAVTNQNYFKAYTRQTIVYNAAIGQKDFLINTLGGDGFDYLNNLTLASPYKTLNPPNQTNGGYFICPYPGLYAFNVKFNYDDNSKCGGNIKFQVIMRKASTPEGLSTGTIVATSDQFELPTCGNMSSVNWFPKVNLLAGEYVKVYIQINQNKDYNDLRLWKYLDTGIETPAPMWDLYESPTLIDTQIVDLRLGLQSINCIDYLKSLITMFNLVVVQDENNKTIKIEPFNWYYNEPERQVKDWTQKQDLSSQYRVEPLSFDLPKEVNWTYTEGSEEYLNKLFEDQNKFNYGRKKYVSSNNILTGEQNYELPFAATPTTVVNGSDNVIMPSFYREIDGITLQPYSNKPHIFFWVGNRFAYLDEFKNFPGFWYLQSGSTSVQQSTYPCVSHLSSLDIYLPNLVSDLNFQTTFDFFGNYNPYILQSVDYTLYNTFWEDYIEDNYSNETRRLTGRFYLKPLDIYETKLTDKIYVKDSFWRIERINEGDLVNNKLTEVSLIKERGGYYKVVPPSPYYGITPNQPYTSFTISATTPFTCYTGTTPNVVCQQTAGTTSVYSYNGGLAPNALIYFNFGSYYGPAPLGTFVQDITIPDTYVVINNIGEIIPYQC
jgi:hypothetical protein